MTSLSPPSLSTHVLDLVHGGPAAGVAVRLLRNGTVLVEATTGADGRCPAIAATPVTPGAYRLEFAVAAYFRTRGADLSDPAFLDVVGIDFAIAAAGGHYHVPLLASPFGYSTYRGS